MDISIVIPSYNDKKKLKKCLESVFRQGYPRDNLEVIVVDDSSDDGTDLMLKELCGSRPNLRYFLQPHKGPAAARNVGIEKAKGEIIAFTDTDCILKENWVEKMLEAHRLNDKIMVIGGLTEVNPRNIKAAVSQFLSNGAVKARINGRLETIFFPTCNVSFKKRFLQGERFNEIFPFPAGEDLEFFWRLLKKGNLFNYKQDIRVFHDCNLHFKSFFRQAYIYGRGNYLVQYMHRDHPLLKEIKTRNSLYFFLGLIITFIKIPRFSCLLGRRLISFYGSFGIYERMQVYLYFGLHKIMYLFGNIAEHRRVARLAKNFAQRNPDNTDTPVRPEFIILDITHRCNLECNICEIRKDKPVDEFTTEEVKTLIDQAIEWGVKEFVLSGGEPFVREDIFEILDFVKEKNYRLGILTNGILLTKDFIKRLLPYLISDTLSLTVSLDALTPEIHDDIRGRKGSFEKTFFCLQTLSELKANHPNINFNVISIILNENLEELLNLAQTLKSLNVNSIQFQPLLANNLAMKERSSGVKYWIPQERCGLLDRAIDELVEFKRKNLYFVLNSENNLKLVKKYFRNLLAKEDVRCLYATKTMLIANNGDITTCFGSYGNTRAVTLKRIWDSEEIKYARERVKKCKNPCLLPCFTDNGNERPSATSANRTSSSQGPIFKITQLQIESTNKCNLKCSICWHTLGRVRQYGELSFYDFKKITEQFEHIKEINLQGLGEPFLARDIFLMIEYARKNDIFVWLTTNATLLTEDYCRNVVKSGLSLLRLSIDTVRPKVYSRIKVGSDIRRVIGNIKTLNRIKKELKSESPRLSINTVALKSNISELKELVELARDLEIGEISLLPLVVFGRGMATEKESMSSDKDLFFNKISEAKEIAMAYNININSGVSMERHPESRDFPQVEIPQCINSCYVNYRGDLSPCCNIVYSFGNIIEKGFAALWNNKKYVDFRNYILNNRPSCFQCNKLIDRFKMLDAI